MDLGLGGARAIVGGASKGIGRAIARGLAAEGARVALLARDRTRLARAAADIAGATGHEAIAVPADLTRPDEVVRAVDEAAARFGGLDILVANAGGPPRSTFAAASDADWQAVFELTLLSVVRLVRAALPHLERSGAGRVITVQSTSVKQPIEGHMLSNGVRPGVQGLVRTLAQEVARRGVTVNSVLPGRIRTDRYYARLEAAAKAGGSREAAARAIESEIPLGCAGEPEDVAHLVVFLASGRARYVTGQAIAVDGGLIRALA